MGKTADTFTRAAGNLKAVADALDEAEAELRAVLSYELPAGARARIVRAIAVLRGGAGSKAGEVGTGAP